MAGCPWGAWDHSVSLSWAEVGRWGLGACKALCVGEYETLPGQHLGAKSLG